ncbi:hypothetical protein ACFU53_40090 [Streptomyces sp. NPDC057474]|uniref:hypothetical protein n=1 Tax=Streptomyces sp. NPDC057474 TaxID=3346144 RepID=UPI0036C5BBBB
MKYDDTTQRPPRSWAVDALARGDVDELAEVVPDGGVRAAAGNIRTSHPDIPSGHPKRLVVVQNVLDI